MEDVIESESTVTHAALSAQVEDVILNPSKIKLKVESADVETAYAPIVQSGGAYDLRISAQSSDAPMSADLILASVGARYRSYCATLTRSFFVNAPPRVEEAYAALLQAHTRCGDALRGGVPLKDVYETARAFLRERHADLLPHLTKSLGFALGLDFRERALDINAKNAARARDGMVFSLNVGLADVPIPEEQRKGSNYKHNTFSMAIGDVLLVHKDEPAEFLTKGGKEWTDISYTLDDSDKEEEEEEGDSEPEAKSKGKKKASAGQSSAKRTGPGHAEPARAEDERAAEAAREGARERDGAARQGPRRRQRGGGGGGPRRVRGHGPGMYYPKDTMPHQIKVDMDREVVLCPINGQPVPFSIHTIKNVVMPEPDNHSFYLRINFFAPGQALGKEASRRMAKLVERFGRDKQAFVKELTFRSLDQQNLGMAFRQVQELRKRLRLREQKAVEEADLVVQAKLIRMTDMKVPRLADLTLRPNLTGKTTGALEAHTNGLRFISIKGESVEILYANIRLAVFQPCEGNDTKVVLHFYLRHPIMVGKKAHKNVQVYTEAVDSTVNLDNARRSHYDPDEIMEEQQDKKLRKRLNQAFKDFAAKVSKVAARNQQTLEFDIPYKELGFQGTPHKEMVFIQPTTYALLNVTDQPAFVVLTDDIEHVHFERVNPNGRNFDLKIITRANVAADQPPSEPLSINMIEQKFLNQIMGWLVDSSITYTQTDKTWNWKAVLNLVREDERFYLDTGKSTEQEDGTKKPAGWTFLRMQDSDGEEEQEEDEESDFKASSAEEEEEESEESFAEDDESDADEDASDDEEEDEGMDWDEMEAKAAADDKERTKRDAMVEADDDSRRKKQRKR
ncbi:FACT complex subunit-domain-containing protein [Tribonema minus]|uniref:FACT complex subunit n=1 Tax=Tribonema minus TaxID=303371 RepID=A0A835Z130_9STRA|nr:FACT complex subunit-domain-containing protein [Tribonema minus]